ncbi:hypothetical protein OFN32_36800, partial [Escherichia coli]|nr:hypothetical protein [Escherichia coli]
MSQIKIGKQLPSAVYLHRDTFSALPNTLAQFIPAVAKNVKADAAAKDQTVTAPVAPEAKTEDIVPGPSAPNTGDQN